jgi:hypothetical protein
MIGDFLPNNGGRRRGFVIWARGLEDETIRARCSGEEHFISGSPQITLHRAAASG